MSEQGEEAAPAPEAEEAEPRSPQSDDGGAQDGDDGGAPPSRTDVLGDRGKPGTIQERLGAERDARRSFEQSTVSADAVIGGDQYNIFAGADKGPVRTARLPDADLAEIERAFVAPDDFDDLLRQARERRVVILQAARAQGRYAAARRLLAAPDRELYCLNPALGLVDLTRDDLTRGAGYICRDYGRTHELDGFALARVAALLEAADARLVITVDAASPLTDPEVAELVLRLGTVADRRPIVRGLLRWWLGEARAERLLGDPEVRQLIEEQLAAPGPPLHARVVAQELVRADKAALPPARTAGQALRLRDQSQLDQWFQGLGTMSAQCMAVALAVLGGEPYETVALTAMELRDRLETEDPREDSRLRRDAPLRPTRKDWLGRLGAHTTASTIVARHGAAAPADVVRYLDPSAQRKVLLYFWSEYDEQRLALLDWLRWCAGHPLESVRIRTAVATGALARKGFDLVRALVIEPWARDSDPRFRPVAAAALRAAAAQPGLRETVRALLDVWGDASAPVALRATAARAWGVEHDIGGLRAALDRLEEFSGDEEIMVTAAVCDSVTELWENEGEGGAVPARLLAWIGDDSQARRLTGRLAFLVAALQLLRPQPGDDFTWPGLLFVASRDDARMREIAALWQDALGDPIVQEDAHDVLFAWARAADRIPLVRRRLARLLRVVATHGPLVAGRVRYAARGWAEGDRTARKSSAEVLNALQGR